MEQRQRRGWPRLIGLAVLVMMARPLAAQTISKIDNSIPANSDTTSTAGRIPTGSNNKGDDAHLYSVCVIRDGATFKMWYSANDGANNRIYHATSTNSFDWVKYSNSVPANSDGVSANGWIPLGTATTKGDGTSTHTPCVIKDGGLYRMWYSGQGGTPSAWRIYYATSPDGLVWTKSNNTVEANSDTTGTQGRLPLGATAGRGDTNSVNWPSVIKDGDGYKMWYVGAAGSPSLSRIFMATSPDGLTWTKVTNVVEAASDSTGTFGRIPLGSAAGRGDTTNVTTPCVIKHGMTYLMWYAGNTGSAYRIYHATSTDGLTWTKKDNTFPPTSDTDTTNGRIARGSATQGDDLNVLAPSVVDDGSRFRIWYRGEKSGSTSTTRVYSATWTKDLPTTQNATATNVTSTSATLVGSLISTGQAATTVRMYWGTNDAGLNWTGWGHADEFAGYPAEGTVTTNVSGLTSNTVYYYRLFATNQYGYCMADPVGVFNTSELTVQATDASAMEPGVSPAVPGTFTISRPVSMTNMALTVNYLLGGSASNGVDYTISAASCVTIAVGVVSVTVTVTPLEDLVPEAPETVTLSLLGGGVYAVGVSSNAVVTIAEAPPSPVVATGGTITNYDGYRAHIFTNTGTSNFVATVGGYVDVLVVAGGGGGGCVMGGGGGAGGLIYTNTYPILSGTKTVTVGIGGNGGNAQGTKGSSGGNSRFGALLAYGGGGAGSWTSAGGSAGGSGGGGAGNSGAGAAGTNGQGYAGGSASGTTYCGGGGGGAGSTGANATASSGGAGGAGLPCGILGPTVYYSGGGGGGARWAGYNGGGAGIGGGGGGSLTTGTNAVPNTGGGGGGGGYLGGGSTNWPGGTGACGIVIIRYDLGLPRLVTLPATNVTTTSANLNGFLSGTGMSATAVTLYWGTNDGQNVAGDWMFSTNTLWPAPQSPGALTFNVADLAPNSLYFYRYYATNGQGETWASTSQVVITGGVTVQATDASASESLGNTGTFTITRPDWATNGALTVAYMTGGTASNGVDYTLSPPSSVTILPGSNTAAVTVNPIPDAVIEPSETVDLTLLPGGYTIGDPSNATVTIADGTWYVATNGLDTNGGNSWGDALATLSNAVARSASNQLILVSNGVYTIGAQITLSKAIIVLGVGGASNTVVNGASATRCFSITSPGAVLDGIAVSNGYLSSAHGAGINMSAGTVQNCILTKNRASSGSGAGAFMTGGVLLNSTIEANSCYGHGNTAEGAGIDLWGGAMVSNCLIRYNINDPSTNYDTGRGGGVLLNSTNSLVTDCIIMSNRASSNYRPHGGGVFVTNGTVERCTISQNVLSGTTWTDSGHAGGGGGVEMDGGVLRNCLIAGNLMTAQGDYRNGGGVKINAGSIVNCTVVRNSAVTNCGGIFVAGGSVVNTIIADNGCATGASNINTTVGVTYSCAPELTGGLGNRSESPLFIGAGSGFGTNAVVGDKHLQLVSPCVDAGVDQTFSNDLERVMRPLDGDGNGSALFDMGCYELSPANLPFSCGFDGEPSAGLAPLTVQFTANFGGSNTNIAWYVWDFTNDGIPDEVGSDKRVVSYTYTSEGSYSVALWVTNTTSEGASLTRTNLIVVSPITYVSPSGSHSAPYTSWTTAATNLQTAIDSAAAGSLVLVTDGVYRVGTAISLAKALTVRSVNGPAVTTIDGGRLTRCLSMAQPDAVFDGFTLCNGYAVGGAGVYMTDGTVQNCVIRNNRDNGTANGGGVWMSLGTLRNCLVAGNRAGYGTYGAGRGGGIAISGGSVENCTVSRNATSLSEGGIYRTAGSIVNTIIYDNKAPSATNINTVTGVTNSCAPELTSGVGNVTGDPRFLDTGRGYGADFVGGNFRLGIGSSCIDAGMAMASFSNDQDGVTRPVDGNGDATPAWDIGAYEVAQGPAAGALRCWFQAATNVGFAPFSPSFTASVAGTNLVGMTYYWDFNGDGTNETSGAGNTASTTYPTASWYTVVLTVSNDSGEVASCARTNYIQMPMDIAYVSTNGTRVPPYMTWGTAANDIGSAVEEIAGTNSPTINVSNGTYAVTVQLALNKGVTVRGVSGSSNTVVNGGGSTRCVLISHPGVVVDGLTISNGYSTASGAGLYMSAAALVKNSTITKSVNSQTAGQAGGIWMSGGTLDNCTISGNRQNGHQSTGGGVYMYGGMLTNCLITGNTMNLGQALDTAYGAGVYLTNGARVLSSTVVSNTSSSNHRPTGAGVYIADNASLVSHCTIQGNRCIPSDSTSGQQSNQGGAGAYLAGGTLRNCLVVGNSYEYSNSATLRLGGGVRLDGGRMENCTVVRNYNINTDGGVYVGAGASVTNSIIYYNSSPSITNINTMTGVGYSCAPELTSGTGNTPDEPRFKAPGSGVGTNCVPGDYRLTGTVGVNAGIYQSWMSTGADLAGKPRVVNGVVDMGAYENQSPMGTSFLFR